jgi:hypothetical protein
VSHDFNEMCTIIAKMLACVNSANEAKPKHGLLSYRFHRLFRGLRKTIFHFVIWGNDTIIILFMQVLINIIELNVFQKNRIGV